MNEKEEQAYQAHLKRERPIQVEDGGHPDGCYFCGGHDHASTDCNERE